ncbi:MAG: sulfite exporter TauE/SafE family protein [Gemmatimonadota bacterium]
MDPGWPAYLILFGVGGIAGTLNVIAGGGSFLTLPLMIFLGLPPTVANGTNRVAILVQNVGAVWSFHRHRVMKWNLLGVAALPALAGATLGAWGAVTIGDRAFQRTLAGLMVAAAVWTLWDPLRRYSATDGFSGTGRLRSVALAIGFFCVGLYGGFVQAGVGFLIIAVVTLGGLDLVGGNALKVLVVLTYTPLTLLFFGLSGKVDWGMGAALASGNLLGALIGVRLIVLKGHAWVKRVVTAAVIAFAIKLWLSP